MISRTRRGAATAAVSLWVLLASEPVLAQSGRRVALVIGNSAYTHTSVLDNPVNDAADMSAALRRLGFEVDHRMNLDRGAMYEALGAFARRSTQAEMALVFYAGHGIEVNRRNYLVPVDAQLMWESDVYQAVELEAVLQATSGAKLRVVILDACRNNPLATRMRSLDGSRSLSRSGLGDPGISRGVLVAYAAEAGFIAEDGTGRRNSPYTRALLDHLSDRVDIRVMFGRVTARVLQATDDGQQPYTYGSVPGEFYLNGRPDIVDVRPLRRVRYGESFHDCDHCPEMVALREGTFTMGSPSSEEGRDDNEGPQRRVQVERFALGRYEVTREEYAAFVSATGYSTGGGCSVLGVGVWGRIVFRSVDPAASWSSPGFAQDGRHPVVCVSWDDARAYAAWLSEETGAEYRLPSESEWEYAARAGTATRWYWGESAADLCRYANGVDSAYKRYVDDRFGGSWNVPTDCSDGMSTTAPVSTYAPNALGLHDMLGNVWELVEDCYHDNYAGGPSDGSAWSGGGSCRRVLRGGSWSNYPVGLRSARRSWIDVRADIIGFRVARTLD